MSFMKLHKRDTSCPRFGLLIILRVLFVDLMSFNDWQGCQRVKSLVVPMAYDKFILPSKILVSYKYSSIVGEEGTE
jgi:hypothetical protein